MNIFTVAVIFLLMLHLPGCEEKRSPESEKVDSLTTVKPQLVTTLSHNPNAFTQGLFYHDGKLYESAGRYGYSSLRVLDTNGVEVTGITMSDDVFAEGCAFFGGRLYQITWKRQRCFVYSIDDLAVTDTLTYEGEGWGLTSDGTYLIMSNGSDTLVYRDERFTPIRSVAVTWRGAPLQKLNELEYAHGLIYANVWYNDFIYAVDPQTGEVKQVVDCTELVLAENPQMDSDVLNGIAWIPEKNLFYCTGKQWKKMFVVRFPQVGG